MQEISRINDALLHSPCYWCWSSEILGSQLLHQFSPPVVLGFGSCLLYVWLFISWKHLKKIVSHGPPEWSSEYKRLLLCVCVTNGARCMHAWFSLGIARPCG